MPDEEKKKPLEKMVELDTSGPEVDVTVEDPKVEEVIETVEEEPRVKEVVKEEEIKEETVKEIKKEQKEDDSKLEDYSKGVQSRIAKLTRKMREAERREAAAVEYAQAIENKRKLDQERFQKVDADYTKRFEESVKTGMDSAQKELALAIEAGDAKAQVEANKRIAELAFDNAKLKQRQTEQEEKPVQLSDGGQLPRQAPQSLPQADPMAEDWAGKNKWFGTNRAMTFTAFEIHKDLVEREGFDPKSNEYYEEIDKRIRVDFPHKFDRSESIQTTRPVQSVASANRSAKTGRKQMRLTSSQVAIAKKLGVPLEDYAKQLKLTEGA
jgi:hypothetical protein